MAIEAGASSAPASSFPLAAGLAAAVSPEGANSARASRAALLAGLLFDCSLHRLALSLLGRPLGAHCPKPHFVGRAPRGLVALDRRPIRSLGRAHLAAGRGRGR